MNNLLYIVNRETETKRGIDEFIRVFNENVFVDETSGPINVRLHDHTGFFDNFPVDLIYDMENGPEEFFFEPGAKQKSYLEAFCELKKNSFFVSPEKGALLDPQPWVFIVITDVNRASKPYVQALCRLIFGKKYALEPESKYFHLCEKTKNGNYDLFWREIENDYNKVTGTGLIIKKAKSRTQ